MYHVLKHAHKSFDEISKRNSTIRNFISWSHYATTSSKHMGSEDSIEIYPEIENVISWTSKISKLARKGQPDQAIGLFKTMLLCDQRPNFVTLVSVIRAYGAFKCQDMIRAAHGYVVKLGFELEVPVLTALLGFYSMSDIRIALKLFDQILHKDVVLWGAVVSACVKNDEYEEAIHYFRRMLYCGTEANPVTVVSVLPACVHLGLLCHVKEIQGFLIRSLCYSLTNVQNSLMHAYAKCVDTEAAILVFNALMEKDLISWRTIIHACIENECPRDGLDIFLKMLYSGTEPDENIIRDIILASSRAEELKFGKGFHGYIEKNRYIAFVSVGTALLQMYSKCSEIGSARMVFDQLNYKDLVAWSAMISVYAQGGELHDAFTAFRKMQSTNEKPNDITFVSLVQACSIALAQELGESIHAFVIKAGCSSNICLKSALIDLYCKFGRIKQGKTLFDEISAKDLICWSSMIKGYGLNGCGLEVLETFANMLNSGVKPNDTVFLSVLSACSLCGLEHEGHNWFYSMQEKYGITPTLAHYACMVDLLGHKGNIKEALKFVKEMPMLPDKRIWGALLAGCRSRPDGSLEVAEFVVEQLCVLDPENPSYYVTLLDLYAERGEWKEMERLRKLVDEKGLRKIAECSVT